MAQPKFQPILNEAATPTYIRPGVVDNSTAVALSAVPGVIKMADTIFEEVSIKNALEQDVNPIIETYEAGYQGTKERKEILNAREALFANAQGVPTEATTKLIDENAKQLEAAMAKITAAEEQGLISPAAAMAKITAATRAAINKNPWLEGQLYERVQRHLKRNGIIDVWSERESIAKSAQEKYEQQKNYYRSKIDGYAKEGYDVKFNEYGTVDEWRAQVDETNEKIAVTTAADKAAERADKIPVDRLKTSIRDSSAHQILDALVGRFSNTSMKMLEGVPSGSQAHPQTIEQIRAEATLLKSKITKLTSGGRGDAVVDRFTEDALKRVDEYTELFEKKYSNEDLRKAIANKTEMERNKQSLVTMGAFNIGMIDAVERLAKALDPVNGISNVLSGADPEKRKKLWEGVAGMYQGAFNTANVKGVFDSGAHVNIFTSLGESIKTNENPFRKQEKIDSALEYVSRMTEALISPEAFNNPKDQASSSLKFLNQVASDKSLGSILSTNSEYGLSIGKVVDNHMNGVIDTFAAVVFKHTAENPNTTFTYDVLENGAFEVKSNDPTIAAEMNKKLSTQVNVALDAYANSLGISRAQAAPAFYTQYFAELTANDPDFLAIQSSANFDKPIDQNTPITGVSDLQESIRITPEQQAERDALRVRVLQQELADHRASGDTVNAKYVEGELRKLGAAPLPREIREPKKELVKPNDIRYLEEKEALFKEHRAAISKVAQQAVKNNSLLTGVELAKFVAKSLGQKLEDVIDDTLNWEAEHRKSARKKLGLDKGK